MMALEPVLSALEPLVGRLEKASFVLPYWDNK